MPADKKTEERIFNEADLRGALFDFCGYLTTRAETIPVGEGADAMMAFARLTTFFEARGLEDAEANVLHWNETVARAETGVYAEIQAERVRQDAQWGGPAHDDRHNRYNWWEYRAKFEHWVMADSSTPAQKRDALVKIAALAVAQIESLDRKRGAATQPPREGEEPLAGMQNCVGCGHAQHFHLLGTGGCCAPVRGGTRECMCHKWRSPSSALEGR